MEKSHALAAFGALSQETRLDAVRLLVRAGPDGLPAGEVAARLGVRHNLMSSHLNVLSTAALVTSERRGRLVLYRARFDTLRRLLGYLMNDCCSGLPEIVAGLAPGTNDEVQTEGDIR